MKVRAVLLLVALLALPLGSAAQEEPRTYVVLKGDTLWGISERFLKDPDYWPSLWSHNPEIRNPHFIYPGRKIRIDGARIAFLPEAAEAPAEQSPVVEEAMVAEVVEEALPEPSEAIVIKALGNGPRSFVSPEELAAAGILIDTVDNRIMMAEGDRVFADMASLQETSPGERFSLFSVGAPVVHPLTGERVGNLVTHLGSLQVTDTGGGVATAVITASLKEIQRGARLLPWEPPQREITLRQASQPLAGVVVGGGSGQLALGQFDYLYVDLGAQDGLQVGNLLYLSRARTATKHGIQGSEIRLPDVLLGTAVVVDVQMNTATALILKTGNEPIRRGDRVTAATQ